MSRGLGQWLGGLVRNYGLVGKRGFCGGRGSRCLQLRRGQGFGFCSFGQLSGGHRSASLGIGVVVLSRESAEEQAGQVTEDRGATGRDEVGCQQGIEALQGVVDTLSVLEVARAIQKLEGKIVGAIGARYQVAMTEHLARVGNPISALATRVRKMVAAVVAGNGFFGCRLHFFP